MPSWILSHFARCVAFTYLSSGERESSATFPPPCACVHNTHNLSPDKQAYLQRYFLALSEGDPDTYQL
jgi:hypothetical protein